MEPRRVNLDAGLLKALAHPLRLQILGVLRITGPSTATRLAERLGESSGLMSYHLRALAAAGLIEEDFDRGTGRDRWWRAAHDVGSFRSSDVEGTDGDARRDGREPIPDAAEHVRLHLLAFPVREVIGVRLASPDADRSPDARTEPADDDDA